MNATSKSGDPKIRNSQNNIRKLEAKARTGNAMAITKLIEIFDQGIRVKKNNRKVLELLHWGAKLKDRYLTWCLADALSHGTYGKANIEQGLKLYKKAAALGEIRAWTCIGYRNFKLAKSQSELKNAVKYYRKAAKYNEPSALYNLGLVHSIGEGGRKSPKMALSYFLRSHENGHKGARFEIGKLYAEEFHDFRNARSWLRRAATSGDKAAISYLKRVE